ncbi:MAG: ABC transporter substrate-binding protein, partial [Christensenellales bacterium]
VIYIPTDNTAASNGKAIANVTVPAKTPVVAGEQGICSNCGVATLSIDYKSLGETTGKMAVKILKGESKVSEMPIEYSNSFVKYYNPDICEQLGIKVPSDDYTALSTEG